MKGNATIELVVLALVAYELAKRQAIARLVKRGRRLLAEVVP